MQITYLPNIRQSAKHHTIQIADYFALVRSGQHLALIEAYRNTKALSKDEQAEAKQRIPAVTISGVFKDNVSNANLIQHSGLICIDFDAVDDVARLKSELAKDPYTFAALLSVSGNGLAALVKIEPERHLDAFNGLKQYYFRNYGQLIDQSCKNVSRLRFLSYDPLLYVNESAKTFKEYPKKEAKPKQVHTVLTGNEFDELIDRICRGGYDLTEGAYNKCQMLTRSHEGEIISDLDSVVLCRLSYIRQVGYLHIVILSKCSVSVQSICPFSLASRIYSPFSSCR